MVFLFLRFLSPVFTTSLVEKREGESSHSRDMDLPPHLALVHTVFNFTYLLTSVSLRGTLVSLVQRLYLCNVHIYTLIKLLFAQNPVERETRSPSRFDYRYACSWYM